MAQLLEVNGTASTTLLALKAIMCWTLTAADGTGQEHTKSNPGLADA